MLPRRFFIATLLAFTFDNSLIAAEKEPLNIYVAGSFDGVIPYMTQGSKLAAEAFIEDVNAKGGLLGRKLNLQIINDRGDVNRADTESDRAMNDPNHLLTVGFAYSNIARPMAVKYAAKQKLLFSTTATNNELKKVGGTYFALSYNDEFQAQMLSEIACHKFKAKNVVILRNVSDSYSDGLASLFEKHFGVMCPQSEKSTIVYLTDKMSPDEIQRQVSMLRKPDLIFLPDLQVRIAPILERLFAANLQQVIYLGSDGWGTTEQTWVSTFLKTKIPEGSKLFFTHHYHLAAPEIANMKIVKDLQQKMGNELIRAESVIAYEGMKILKQAMLATGCIDANCLSRYIRGRKFNMANGTIFFSLNGETKRPGLLLELTQGGTKFVKKIEGKI